MQIPSAESRSPRLFRDFNALLAIARQVAWDFSVLLADQCVKALKRFGRTSFDHGGLYHGYSLE